MDPTERFSARAEVYARARPAYPPETLRILQEHYGLGPTTVVADLGAGTGIFTRLLLEAGATVYAVEPNSDMREEAERASREQRGFVAIAGRAEATGLGDASVDLVTAAQAFHWFELAGFRRELVRILRREGRAALIWNDRDVDGTPFLREYEAILQRHCPGFLELQGKSDTPAKFDEVFGGGGWSRHVAANEQRLDRDALVNRVMSASYAPAPGTPGHVALVEALHSAFDRHSTKGEVRIGYSTVVIGGRPVGAS
jgi:SAM-dependent methyltransferase